MATKKKTTSRVSSAFTPKDRPAPTEARKAAGKLTEDDKRKPGRPKVDHNLKRTSILAGAERMQRMKVAAAKENRHFYELMNDAMDAYLDGK
jgi:hypothetical protein